MIVQILFFVEVAILLWFFSTAIFMAIRHHKDEPPLYPSKRSYNKCLKDYAEIGDSREANRKKSAKEPHRAFA